MSYNFTSEFQYNKYDRARLSIMNKPLFSDVDWREAVSNGTVDSYIYAIQNSDKVNPDEFYKKYNLYYGDPTSKLAALYTEFGTDRNSVGTYNIPLYDGNGNFLLDENGKQLFETLEMSEYDYRKKMIADANTLYSERKTLEAMRNDQMNDDSFGRWLTNATGWVHYVGQGFLAGLENIKNVAGGVIEEGIETTGRAIDLGVRTVKGEDTPIRYGEPISTSEVSKYLAGNESFAQTMNKWYTDYSFTDDTAVMLDQFIYNNTNYYDSETGQMTTLARWCTGVANMVGELLPTILLTLATKGAGTAIGAAGKSAAAAGKATKIAGALTKAGTAITSSAGYVGQIAYYGSNVFGRNVSEQFDYYASQGITISSTEIVVNSAVKTALEFGISAGLSKLIGVTSADKLSGLGETIWGRNPKANILRFSDKSLTGKAFLRIGKDALQEGVEEALQETSSWLVDSTHHFINSDFQSTEWSWQNIGDAFMIALIASIGGSAGDITGSTTARLMKTKSFTLKTDAYKTDKDGNLIKDKDGNYEFVKLNPLAAWEFGLDMESYVNAINSLTDAQKQLNKLYDSLSEEERKDTIKNHKMDKALSQYAAGYYQAMASFKILSSIYGEIGEERFNKANEILKQITAYERAGIYNPEFVSKAQDEIVNSFDVLDVSYRIKMKAKLNDAKITKVDKVVNEGDAVESETEAKASEFLKKLENVSSVVVSKDGIKPVLYKGILIIPEKLLNNASEKVIMSTLAEQELADELAEGVLTKSKYFNNEIGIITDLYRQWSANDNATEQEAVYNLIFDPKFFEIVLALNERLTSSFVLRLNGIVKVVGEGKNFKDSMVLKRVEDCRTRWIEAAYSFYSNNLEKDTSLFTDTLSASEKSDFNKRIGKLLAVYNMGSDIVTKPKSVSDETWSFIERRIDNINADEVSKNEVKTKLKSNNMKDRQEALDYINEVYNGAFNTLYNGSVYMPLNSIGNYALNSWLQSKNLTLKTFINNEFLTDEELSELGPNYSLDDVITLRSLQFNSVYPNMEVEVTSSGSVSVSVKGGDSGFSTYANLYNKYRSDIVSGKLSKVGETEVEQSIVTDLRSFSKWIKAYLNDELVSMKAYNFLTIDEIISNPDYLNSAVKEDIRNSYEFLDRNSVYQYLQKQLALDTNGKQSLIIKRDGTIAIGDMSVMKSILISNVKFPSEGVHSISKFVKGKFLHGSLANTNVVFRNGGGSEYVDYVPEGNVYKFVNTIYIDTSEHSSDEELSFAICHEFQHAIQTENRLGAGMTSDILNHLSKTDRKTVISIVKELEPKLFTGVTDKKDIENIVNSYLYHSSGEFQAMGLGSVGIFSFYPTLVSRKNGDVKISFRDGRVIEVKANKSIIDTVDNIFDQSKKIFTQYYSKYNLNVNENPDLSTSQSVLNELSQKKDKTNVDYVTEMYYTLNPDKSEEEFRNSNLIGISLNNERYVVSNVSDLYVILNAVLRNKSVTDDKIAINAFTFKPKDIKSFVKIDGVLSGKIVVDKSYTKNNRNLLIDIANVPSEITQQSMLIKAISLATKEYVYQTEYLSDIDEDLSSLVKKYNLADVEPLTLEIYDYNVSDDVKDLFTGWFKSTNKWIMSNPNAYRYFKAHLEKYDSKLVNVPALSSEEKQKLLDDWNESLHKKTHHGSVYNILKHFYHYETYEDFLNQEVPIISLRGSLRDDPFVSASILYSDSLSPANTLFSLSKSMNDNEVKNLYLGKCKMRDVFMFVPNGMNEILISEKHFNKVIPVSKSIGFDANLNYAYHLDTISTISQKLDKSKISVGKDLHYVNNEAKKEEVKLIVDRRSKSERKVKPEDNPKKYTHSRTPLGDSKHATRIVTAKDIRKDIESSGKSLAKTKGGDYVYRKFVERRYFMNADMSEGYKDIFDYYTPKKERRHTLKSDIGETNLKYFTTEKGKSQITMSPQLREFVIASTYVDIDPVIMDLIKKGKLTTNDLIHYVIDNKASDIDHNTFKLILNKIFGNEHIKSAAHLTNLISDAGYKMTALYITLKDTDFEDLLYEECSEESLENLWNFAMSQKKFADDLTRIYEGLTSGTDASLKYYSPSQISKYGTLNADVLTAESIYKFMKMYKGDVASGSRAMLRARKATYKDALPVGKGYIASRFGERSKWSLDAKITAGKGTTFMDQTAAKEDSADADIGFDYDYDDILNELMDVSDGLGQRVAKVLIEKIMAEHNNDYTFTKMSLGKYMVNLSQLSEEQIISLYHRLLNELDEESLSKLYYLAELPGFEDVVIESDYVREQNVKNTLNKVINYGSIVQGIKRRLVTIKKNVNTVQGRNILKSEYPDIFDDDLNLRLDAYRAKKGYKSIEIIRDLSKKVAEISKAAKAGVYYDRTSYENYVRAINAKSKQFDKLYKTIVNPPTKGSIKNINISTDYGNLSVKVNKQSEIPKAITQILSVGLHKTGYNKVQELSTYHEKFNEDGSVDKVYDDRYLKLTMTHLLSENAELLNALSEDEAIEILEFYAGDNVILADAESQIVSETVRLLVAYLLGEARYSSDRYGEGFERFNFDEELVKRVEAKMIDQAHISAAMLSNQRTIIRLLQPNKVIGQQISKNLGFKLDDVDQVNLDNMLTQMRVGNKESYAKAKKTFETKLIKDYDEKSKKDIIDKLLTFERAMMLSNPGTWLRNVASNYIVEGGNIASHDIGKIALKLFTKNKGKFNTLDGYNLDKKASKETNDFIKAKFIDSGFLNEIAKGISKYDDWSTKSTVSDDLISAAARAIHDNIRRNQVFSQSGKFGKLGKLGNTAIKLVYKGLDDDPWVRRTTIRYFGKILEEDYAKAKLIASKKGKTLSYEDFLKDDKSNFYGISKHVASSFSKALSLASYDYMKTSNFINRMERALREGVPRPAWFMYKQVFPFLASSWNWCVEGMRYTPAGLASAIIKLARLEHTVSRMDEAYSKGQAVINGEFARYLQTRNLGKGIIGTFGFAVGCILASFGIAGIDGEDDEYKLMIGDLKVNINDVLGSQGVMLGIALTHNLLNDNKDVEDVFAEVFNQLFRDSIFQNFIDTFRYDTGFGDLLWDLVWDIPLQFWPSFIKSISSVLHYRGVEYSNNAIVSKLQRLYVKNTPLPVALSGAKVPINPYTGKAESFWTGELLTEAFSKYSPIDVSYPSVNNNEARAIGLGVKKGSLNGKYVVDGENIKLTSTEVQKLNVLYGKLNNQDLTKLYNNSLKVSVKTDKGTYEELVYSRMNDDEKRAAINNAMSNNSSLAKIYILTSSGRYKYYATKSEYDKLRKLGITKNVYLKNDKKSGFVKI